VKSTAKNLSLVAKNGDSDVDMDEAPRWVRQGGMSAADIAAHEAASYVRPISAAQLRLETDAAYAMRDRQAREAAAWETARAAA
jgi:hypothetical protein